jgi:hypothetical protein
MARQRVVLGLVPRTGRAAVVVVGGSVEAPNVLAKGRIDVATTFDEGAVFHVSQDLPLEKARVFVRESEQRFIERARSEPAAFVTPLGGKVAAEQKQAAPWSRGSSS